MVEGKGRFQLRHGQACLPLTRWSQLPFKEIRTMSPVPSWKKELVSMASFKCHRRVSSWTLQLSWEDRRCSQYHHWWNEVVSTNWPGIWRPECFRSLILFYLYIFFYSRLSSFDDRPCLKIRITLKILVAEDPDFHSPNVKRCVGRTEQQRPENW